VKYPNMKLPNNAVGETQLDWDVETIAEEILTELNGAVPRSTIQEVLNDVVPKYEEAPLQTYVPIFIRRDAVDRLRSMQTPVASPVSSETNASTGSQTRSGLASS
jgi:hypothetical protein